MSGLNRAIKACILFIIGLYLQHVFIVGDSWLILISRCASILILANLLYIYGSTYKNQKLPENDLLVTIIGAGASGIAMAIKLKELGVRFRLLEKGQRLGGTWWYNQYPGCACDIGSVMYSYSFELNPDWTRSYTGHQEILQYLENTADKYGITEHIEYEKCVQNTVWDSAKKTWRVELNNGEVFVCNIIVSGVGVLHVPSKPTFAGADTFKGEVFHSAEWPQGWDPAGKRVAVIGTGASAVQIVPTIADKVKSMTVFQRSATWTMPKDDYPIRHFFRVLFRLCPFLLYFMRIQLFWRLEFIYLIVFRGESFLHKIVKSIIKIFYFIQVKDPDLRSKLTPDFALGCKRVTPSNTYLASFNQPNIFLETSKISQFTENGIRTADGNEHSFDVVVYATGFDIIQSVKSFEAMTQVTTAAGTTESRTLCTQWDDCPNAYKGITVPGFPNLFFLLGPGTALAHNSVIFMFECQITYVIDAITKMVHNNIKCLDVKKEVNDKYQEWSKQHINGRVFNHASCSSWYRNKSGINWTLWPSHLTRYWWITRKIDLNNYNTSC